MWFGGLRTSVGPGRQCIYGNNVRAQKYCWIKTGPLLLNKVIILIWDIYSDKYEAKLFHG